jgi:hypothetical protein
MSLEAISQRAAGATGMFLRKHGPVILTGAGIAGFAATTYLVGKAVLRAQEPLEARKKRIREVANVEITESYTEKDRTRAIGRVWIIESAKIVRIFAAPIAIGGVSVLCIVTAHGLMRRQQASLVAAYMALDKGFRAYRARVQEEYGAEKELELYRGVRVRRIEDDGEDYVACEIDPDDFIPSIYGKFFDESNANWTKTPEWNLQFVRGQQNYANDRLQAYGYVFLNEVYEWLGLPRTQAGQIVGWRKKGNGDGFVDFGIYDIGDENQRAFVNGLEASCFLDFNVDGPITI